MEKQPLHRPGHDQQAPPQHQTAQQAHTVVAIPGDDLSSLSVPAWLTCLFCNCICGGIAIHYASEANNGVVRPDPPTDHAHPTPRARPTVHLLALS